MLQRNKIISTTNENQCNLESQMTYSTNKVVYLIECAKCEKQYVGETTQTLAHRLLQHRNAYGIENRILYNHFGNVAHAGGFYKWARITPIKPLPGTSERRCQEVKTDFIHLFDIFIPKGLNVRKSLICGG